jgi:ribonucleoside-diphosphate reductase alpha chain
MTRRILPQRRRAESFDLRFWNQRFTVTVGFFDDDTIGEVFVDARKTGGDIEAIARDAAVAISLALQHGATVESIREAVTRNGAGEPVSILGAVVDTLATDRAPS